MKTKNILLVLLIGGVLLFCLNFSLLKLYDSYIYSSFNKVMATIRSYYPDGEIEAIHDLVNEEEMIDVLGEYGITLDTIKEIDSYQSFRNKIVLGVTITFVLLGGLFFFLYYGFKKKVKNEIEIINLYLNDILNGNYEIHIGSYQEDLISILKNDIYKVTRKLKEYSLYEQKEQQFLMNTLEDISHQLKTPLTALMITNDILVNNDLTKEERNSFLEKETKELEKMEWLITTLLKLSKLDSGQVIFKKEKILVDTLIDEALSSLLVSMELKNIEVIKKHLDFSLFCDIAWLREALTNILKNAYEHSLKDGKIVIQGEDNPVYKAILITDYGVGIPKKDIKNIFRRFYSTSSSKNSMGIGLNMSRIIVEKHQGKIEVESVVGKFTTFKIIFMKGNC